MATNAARPHDAKRMGSSNSALRDCCGDAGSDGGLSVRLHFPAADAWEGEGVHGELAGVEVLERLLHLLLLHFDAALPPAGSGVVDDDLLDRRRAEA